MVKRANLFVSGDVQGVFFRANTKEKAEALGLVGWVANMPGGSVNILAQGEEADLTELINWCRSGPGFAKVDKVEVKWEKVKDEFKNFEIKIN